MRLQAHGIETDLLPGWEGRIALRTLPRSGAIASSEPAARALGTEGERPNPVVHLANFALPEQRGDFGSGAVDVMTEEHVLVVLFEYGPESLGKALFKRRGLPVPLTPNSYNVTMPG